MATTSGRVPVDRDADRGVHETTDGAGGEDGDARGGEVGSATSWLVYALALAMLVGAWSFASPRFSGPDEPAHVIKAASVVRGQFRPPADPDGNGQIVRVPERFARADELAVCFAFRHDVTADCADDELPGSDASVEVATQAGSYPPLYYLLVGWPTLISHDADVLYAMRLLSGAGSVVLLVLATRALAMLVGRRLAMGSMLVVVTPMVVFLSAVVNPSGLEVSAAAATWCTAMAAAARVLRGERVGVALAAGFAVSAGILASTRWLGPMFVVLILCCVALTTRLGPLARGAWEARRERAVATATIAVATVFLAAVAHSLWMGNRVLLPGSPVPPGDSAVEAVLGNQQGYLQAMIGVFGWLDIPIPTLTYWIWLALVGLVVVLAVTVGERTRVRAMAVTAAVTFLLPFSQVLSADRNGLPWQGRYGLPVAVGLVLLAVTTLARAMRAGRLRVAPARLVAVLAPLAALGHVAAFYWAEHRYAVGLAGEADIWRRGHWAPPGGNLGLLAAASVALLVLTWSAMRPARGGGAR